MTDNQNHNNVVTRWVEGYERAWKSNDPNDIRAIFTEDAEYRTRPHREPWRGHDEIVAKWVEFGDTPDEVTFEWQQVVSSPETAVVRGITRYADDDTYHNLWVIQLAPDGRATSFTEWWMEEPKEGEAAPSE